MLTSHRSFLNRERINSLKRTRRGLPCLKYSILLNRKRPGRMCFTTSLSPFLFAKRCFSLQTEINLFVLQLIGHYIGFGMKFVSDILPNSVELYGMRTINPITPIVSSGGTYEQHYQPYNSVYYDAYYILYISHIYCVLQSQQQGSTLHCLYHC